MGRGRAGGGQALTGPKVARCLVGEVPNQVPIDKAACEGDKSFLGKGHPRSRASGAQSETRAIRPGEELSRFDCKCSLRMRVTFLDGLG